MEVEILRNIVVRVRGYNNGGLVFEFERDLVGVGTATGRRCTAEANEDASD